MVVNILEVGSASFFRLKKSKKSVWMIYHLQDYFSHVQLWLEMHPRIIRELSFQLWNALEVVFIFHVDQVHKKLVSQSLYQPQHQSQNLVRRVVTALWEQSSMITNVFHENNAPVSCVGGCFSQERRFQRIATCGKFDEWCWCFIGFTVVGIYFCALMTPLIKFP